MKYPKNQLELLEEGLLKLTKFYGVEVSDLKNYNVHSLYYNIFSNYTFENENPNVKKHKSGERMLKKTEFVLYPEGIHDNQIETAMNKVIKNLIKKN
jgi:hypothetical protein